MVGCWVVFSITGVHGCCAMFQTCSISMFSSQSYSDHHLDLDLGSEGELLFHTWVVARTTNEPFYKRIKHQSKTSRNNCFPSRLAGESQEGGFVGARRLSWWRDAGADSGHSGWQIFCRLSHFITSYNISAAGEVWRQEEGKVRRSAQLFVWHIYSQTHFYLIVSAVSGVPEIMVTWSEGFYW